MRFGFVGQVFSGVIPAEAGENIRQDLQDQQDWVFQLSPDGKAEESSGLGRLRIQRQTRENRLLRVQADCGDVIAGLPRSG